MVRFKTPQVQNNISWIYPFLPRFCYFLELLFSHMCIKLKCLVIIMFYKSLHITNVETNIYGHLPDTVLIRSTRHKAFSWPQTFALLFLLPECSSHPLHISMMLLLTSLRSVFICHLLSEIFPGHPISNETLSPLTGILPTLLPGLIFTLVTYHFFNLSISYQIQGSALL